jgi:hypothetical protein
MVTTSTAVQVFKSAQISDRRQHEWLFAGERGNARNPKTTVFVRDGEPSIWSVEEIGDDSKNIEPLLRAAFQRAGQGCRSFKSRDQ